MGTLVTVPISLENSNLRLHAIKRVKSRSKTNFLVEDTKIYEGDWPYYL